MHAYFVARQQRAVAALTEVAEGITDYPQSLARQVLAMMDGLQLQWLCDPETTDLVREWDAAARVLFGQLGT